MNWYDGLTLGKYPGSIVDYPWDWSEWLGTETIGSATVTASSGLTVDSTSNDATTVTARVSGGTQDVAYLLTCEVTSLPSGRKDARPVTIDCGEPPGKVIPVTCP